MGEKKFGTAGIENEEQRSEEEMNEHSDIFQLIRQAILFEVSRQRIWMRERELSVEDGRLAECGSRSGVSERK